MPVAHTAIGRKAGLNGAEIDANRAGTSHDAKAAVAVKFARSLAAHMGEVTTAELIEMRDAGYSESDIVEVITHVGNEHAHQPAGQGRPCRHRFSENRVEARRLIHPTRVGSQHTPGAKETSSWHVPLQKLRLPRTSRPRRRGWAAAKPTVSAELGEREAVTLGLSEIEFIRARDSFYQGTVGENGWPYVQHRGGPAGLLKVLDAHTIGYADFTGNRQYISVGNLDGDNRLSLFLMDYPGQRRLKIWGRARLVDENTDPALIARLESPDYRARVERGVVITVEAFDWNCPKYITPRFTEREVRELAGGWPHDTVSNMPDRKDLGEIGTGSLKLVVTGMRQLTPRVRAYELRAPDWGDLPPVTAGRAHCSPGSTVRRHGGNPPVFVGHASAAARHDRDCRAARGHRARRVGRDP